MEGEWERLREAVGEADRLFEGEAESLDESDAETISEVEADVETDHVAERISVAEPEPVGGDREAEVDCVKTRLMLLVPINVIEADAEGPVREALMVTDSVAVRLSV